MTRRRIGQKAASATPPRAQKTDGDDDNDRREVEEEKPPKRTLWRISFNVAPGRVWNVNKNLARLIL